MMPPRLTVLACVLLAAPLLDAAAATHTATLDPELGPGELRQDVWIVSDGTRAQLALDPTVSKTESVPFVPDATQGPLRVASALQGRGAKIEIPLSVGQVPQLYLNLSEPIRVRLWLGWGANPAATDVTLRVELHQDSVLLGGHLAHFGAATTKTGWVEQVFRFRPEARLLDADKGLRLDVMILGGLGMIELGTGGTHPSRIEFRGFTEDPWRLPLYLQENRAYVVPTGEPPAGGGSTAPAAGLLALAAFPGLGRRGGRARLAVALLLVGALAGCFGGKPSGTNVGATDATSPALKPTKNYRPDPNLSREGIGALEGTVIDALNLPIKSANVVLLGTAIFGVTDAGGTFRFPNVSVGIHQLHVDAKGFLPFDESIEVRRGEVLVIRIPLARPAGPNGAAPHPHPYFDDTGVKQLWDATFPVQSRAVLVRDSYGLNQSLGMVCPYTDNCETPIPFNVSTATVPPGTGEVIVTLKFAFTDGVKELGLGVWTSLDGAPFMTQAVLSARRGDFQMLPRESGVEFHVPILPEESDVGHQRYTQWKFTVWIPNPGAATLTGPPLTRGGPVTFSARAVRAVVPLEPAHRDFWGPNQTITLFSEAAGGWFINDLGPLGTTSGGAPWKPVAGLFVPPGSKEIRGSMTWQGFIAPQPEFTKWTLMYKTAGSPVWKHVSSTPNGSRAMDFVIPVGTDEADQYYQRYSLWEFANTDQKDDLGSKGASDKRIMGPMKLSAIVHRGKDPAR